MPTLTKTKPDAGSAATPASGTLYRYRATTDAGESVKGVTEARSPYAARAHLMEQGLDVGKLKRKTGFKDLELSPQRVKPSDLMHTSRQLAAFIRAGIPILDALDTLAEGTDNKTLREVLLDLGDALRAGESLAAAMTTHPKVFPNVYVGVVRMAELTGNLDTALDQLADYLERDLEARRRVRSALVYPMVIVVAAILAVVVISTFVMPRFERFFANLDAELPLPTRMLLTTTGFLTDWWWALAAGIGALSIALVLAMWTVGGRRRRDALVLRLPVIGSVVQTAIVERFCRTLGSMVDAGVPLTEALEVAAEGTNNAVYAAALGEVREEMLRGEGLAGPIAATELFPGPATQMIHAGEQTGALDDQLTVAAGFYGQELDYRIKHLTTLFEPAVILFMGAIVGFVAIALVSAMYGIFSQTSVFGS